MFDEFGGGGGTTSTSIPGNDFNPEDMLPTDDTTTVDNSTVASTPRLSTMILAPDELHKIYLHNTDPEASFLRMINVMLDNYIYYVQFSGAAPLPPDSIYAPVDPLGISGQFADILGPTGDEEGKGRFSVEVVEIRSEGGQDLLRNYHSAEAFKDENNQGILYNDLDTDTQRAEVDTLIGTRYAGHEFMFLAPAEEHQKFRDPAMLDKYPEGEQEQIPMVGIFPSYDGTNMGYISDIEEMLAGVPLDQRSLDFYMSNLEMESPDIFRAVQAQLSVLGFYNTDAGGPDYGNPRSRDRQAFRGFVADIMNQRIRIQDYNRKNPLTPVPMTEVSDYLDNRFWSIIEENSADWGMSVERDSNGNIVSMSPMQGLQSDVERQIVNTLNTAWKGTGRTVGEKELLTIEKAMNELYVSGEIDPTQYETEGFADYMRLADSFGAEYYGGKEGWENNIRIGMSGNKDEYIRMAKAAGVSYTKPPTTGPAGQGVDDSPNVQQRKDVFRWFFTTLLNKNNGNFEAASQEFANTFGAQTFRLNQYDSNWLGNVVQKAQTPNSFGHVAGTRTFMEQSEERLEALNDVSKRVQVAAGFGDVKSNMAQKAANDVLASFTAMGGNQRNRGTRI